MFGSHTKSEFEAAFRTFFEGCKRITKDHYKQQQFANKDDSWDDQWLKKRVRVKRDGGAHCFVDYETGDVLKAASWAEPAKHARGNIYDADNGLGKMGPYGPAYLR
jgi:hypothetical protein